MGTGIDGNGLDDALLAPFLDLGGIITRGSFGLLWVEDFHWIGLDYWT